MNHIKIVDNLRGLTFFTAILYAMISFVASVIIFAAVIAMAGLFAPSIIASIWTSIFIAIFTPIGIVTAGLFALAIVLVATGFIKNDY